jgi:hypothetical protein
MNKIPIVLASIISTAWELVKFPLTFFVLFWISGAGLYHGIVASSGYGELITGKAIIITAVDLKSEQEKGEVDE